MTRRDFITGTAGLAVAAGPIRVAAHFDKRIIEGAGHFVPHEKPDAVSAALVDVLNATKSSG